MKDVCIYDYDDQCCYECPGCPRAVSHKYETDDFDYYDYEYDDYHEQRTETK